MAEEFRTKEVATNAAMGAVDDGRPTVASKAMDEPPVPVDTVVVGSEDNLPVTTEIVVETVPLTEPHS